MPPKLARDAIVVTPSSMASLDRRVRLRTIQRRSRKNNRREHSRVSFSGIHFRTAIPVRGRGCRTGPVARLHRSDPRRAHRDDAVLRTHTRRSGRPVAPVADPRARPSVLRGASRVESSGYGQQSLRLWPSDSSRCPYSGHLRRRGRVPDGRSRDVSRTKSASETRRAISSPAAELRSDAAGTS